MKKILATIMALFVVLSFDSFTAAAAVDSGSTAQYATVAPVIDGKIDAVWEDTDKVDAFYGSDLTYANGYAKILWKEDTLYLMAVITDSTVYVGDNNTANQACFWVSETASNAQEYAGGDWNMSINQAGVYDYYSGINLGSTASYASEITATGYVVEVAVPIQTEFYAYDADARIGFCLSVEDDVDGDNERDHVCASQDQNYWSVPANLYTITLVKTSANGWVKENGKWYFYTNGTTVKNSWRNDSKGWVYLGADGAMKTNAWQKDSKGWCYLGADGYPVTNTWKKDSKGWCYLDANGYMTMSKWVKTSNKWYYLDANGYMITNKWQKDSKGWCYVGADGAMVTNKWVTDSKGWCYVGADGYAVTNTWKKDSKGWIYLDANGSMTKSKWVKDGGQWYYCDASGYMVANKTLTISGKKYTFNASGVWVK